MKEYRDLFREIPFKVVSLDDEGVTEEVDESGSSFEENARIKATSYAAVSGLVTLSDDSGLEVDALAGAPGVMSARYGGPAATDGDRVALLLENLKDAATDDRTGRFRCVIAIASRAGEVKTVTGVVEGLIQRQPKGANGFGYDPIFYLPSLGRTMAELSVGEKNRISPQGSGGAEGGDPPSSHFRRRNTWGLG